MIPVIVTKGQIYKTPVNAEPTFSVESTKIVAQKAGRFMARAALLIVDNVLILSYIERDDHGVGDITIHLRFSDDYGTTWSDEDKYLDGSSIGGFPYSGGVGNNYYLVKIINCPDGSLLMLRPRTAVSLRSNDKGKNWTEFSPTFPSADQYGIEGVPFDFNIVLGNTIYMPLKYYSIGEYPFPVSYANALDWAYSVDNGNTWIKGQRIAFYADPPTGGNTVGANPPTQGADEPMFTYHGNGFFRMAGRITTVDGFYGWELPEYGAGSVTISDLQNQINWAAGRLSGHQRAKLQNKSNWWNDPVLFAFGFEFTVPGSGDDRRHCFIASKDAGATWIGPYYLDVTMHDGGYGDVIYNPLTDEYVFISYYELNSGDKATIKQYNVSVNWT